MIVILLAGLIWSYLCRPSDGVVTVCCLLGNSGILLGVAIGGSGKI